MIDVIIPTRSDRESLQKLVGEIVLTAGCHCRIVYTGTDGSASANRNIGLDQTHGEAVIMVDDDIEFGDDSHGWLRIMAEALQRPDVVMVSAQLFDARGKFTYMTGIDDVPGLQPKRSGESVVPTKKLLTACCGFKPHGLRFDEGYLGSGFEDIDFCHQLAAARPDGIFLVCHDAHAIHRNEAKNQRGTFWDHNEAYYKAKWEGKCESL